MLIYKIFRAEEWRTFELTGHSAGAPIDVTDGYIHFSTAEQATETAAKHFADATDLWLLAFEAQSLGDDLKWEQSRGSALFPHLYRDLNLSEMLWSKPLPLVAGQHVFPDGMS